MGRIALFAAAALLFVTAIVHAGGQPMIDAWLGGLSHEQRMAIGLVWLTDSLSWTVVAFVWTMTAWRREPGWRAAAWATMIIPLATAMGLFAIDPTFFGGWMLAGSVALATVGLLTPKHSDAA